MNIYDMSCMCSRDGDNPDRILGEDPVSDELVMMTESPQLTNGSSQNLQAVVPPPTNDACSAVELPPHKGMTGELQGGGPCQPEEPCLPLADLPHLCIISHMNNAGIL